MDNASMNPENAPFRSHERETSSCDAVWRISVGLMVLWLGIVLLFRGSLDPWWGYMLSGFGVVFLIEAWIRMSRPQWRQPVGGKIIAGVVLVFIGGVFISGLTSWWAVALVVVGLVFVVQGVRRLQRSQPPPGE